MRPRFPLLSKLPKAKRWTAVNYRFQTPGLVEPLFPGYKPYKNGDLGGLLDPRHPATNMRLGSFPRTSDLDAFAGRIYPMAILITGASAFGPNPFMKWQERVEKAREDGFSGSKIAGRFVLCQGVDEKGRPQPYQGREQVYPQDDHNTLQIPTRNATPPQPYLKLALRRAARRVPMSFSVATSKKRMGTLAFMRAKIVKRIRGVLDLLVSRGVYVKEDQVLAFNEADTGRKWSLQGWTYLFYPTTEIYNMALPDLIILVRTTLEKLNEAAIRQENVWLAEALHSDKYSHSSPPKVTRVAEENWKTTMSGVDVKSPHEIMYRIRKPKPSRAKRPVGTLSFGSTGGKNREAWKTELEAGLALLTKHSAPENKKSEAVSESPTEK